MNPQSLESRSKSIFASGRRQLLWNVSEPGDPYDIKKSMIAKMPGDRKVQMGSNIELVCLLQAAEIERLCEFLEDYKLRFREIERSSLDRHSYEVQIKELTQRLAEEETARTDHAKLVEFVKKQQAQIAYLHSIPRDNSANDGLRQTYERSLQLTNQLSIQNRDLRDKLQELRVQLQTANVRYEALEKSKSREFEELKTNFASSSRQSYESSLATLRVQYESQLRKWDFEVKRLKELNEAKNAQLNDMIYQRQELIAQLQAKPEQGSEDLHRQIYEYENKFVLFGQEIERLNIALRDYTSKLEDSEMHNRELEIAVERADIDKRDAELRLRNANGENAQLADQIRRLEIEIKKGPDVKQVYAQYELQITDLAARLKTESEASRRFREESERLAFELSKGKVQERENTDLRLQADQLLACQKRLAETEKRLAETENRVAVMREELERLRSVLKGREAELEKAKSGSVEGEEYKLKLKEVESSIVSKYQYEITRVKTDYEQRVAQVMRKGSQVSTRSQFFQSELDRLTQQLRVKSEQVQRIRGRMVELQSQLNRGEQEQTKTRIRTFEATNAALKRDNEELFAKVRAMGEAERRNGELQARVGQFEKELDRLGQIATAKEEELNSLRSRLREYQNANQRMDTDVRTRITTYEQTISSIRAQNDEIRRRQSELVADSNRKLAQSAAENERLALALRKAVDERSQLQASLRKEMSRVSSNLEQANTAATRELQALRKKSADYESKLSLLSQQFQRLNLLLRNKSEECVQNETKLRNVSAQLQTTRRQFKEYEASVRNTLQGEVAQKLTAYEQRVRGGEQNIQKLQGENEELRRRYGELDSRYQQLYQESMKLRETAQRESQYINNENQLKKRVAVYQNNVLSLTRLNEELQKKIVETDAAARQRAEECNRLEAQLRNAMAENEGLRRQAKESEYSIAQRFESEMVRRQSAYDQNIGKVSSQNDELRRRLQQLAPDYERSKAGLNMLTQQNDVLKHKIESYETSINKYEAEVKHRFLAFEQENEDRRRRIAEYENKIALLSQEQERLTGLLKQNAEDYRRKTTEYEQRLQGLSQELERVNGAYRQRSEELVRLQQNVKGVSSENELYRKKIQEYQTHSGKYQVTFSQLESRLTAASQEIERNNQLLRGKQEENSKLEQLARSQGAEAETWRHKYADLEANYQHTFEFEVNKKYGAYEQSIAELRRKGGEYQNKLLGTTQQIERLNNVLRLKVEQSQQQGARLSAISSQLQESKRRLRELEQVGSQNQNARKENEELVRKLHELQLNIRQNEQTNERRAAEYEGRVRALAQEGERLGQLLKTKNEEIQLLKRQFKEYQETVSVQVKSSHGQYESAVVALRKENEELKRSMGEAGPRLVEYENKLALASQEMERLKLLLKGRSEELAKLEGALGGHAKQNEELRRRLQQVTEIGRKLAEYEVKMGQLVQENDKLQLALRNKTEELASCDGKLRQMQTENDGLKKQLREYEFEFGRKVSAYEQGNAQLRLEQENALKKRTEYETKIAMLSQELERVTTQLRSKSEEFQNYKRTRQSEWEGEYQVLQRNYTIVNEEAQTAKLHLIEYEQTLRKINGQIERLHGILNELKKERDTLIVKNRTLSTEIERLNKVNSDLEEQTRDIRLRLIDQTSLQTRISEHMALMVILFAEIETLRQRIRAKEIEVNTVRKESLAPSIV